VTALIKLLGPAVVCAIVAGLFARWLDQGPVVSLLIGMPAGLLGAVLGLRWSGLP
jgi:hypothetical protein